MTDRPTDRIQRPLGLHTAHTLDLPHLLTSHHLCRQLPTRHISSRLVLPHGDDLLLEQVELELERRARVRDLEVREHGRVQDAERADFHVCAGGGRRGRGGGEDGGERGGNPAARFGLRFGRVVAGCGAVVDRRSATREEGRICMKCATASKNATPIRQSDRCSPSTGVI